MGSATLTPYAVQVTNLGGWSKIGLVTRLTPVTSRPLI